MKSKYIHIYDGEFSSSNKEHGDVLSLACIIIQAETLEFVDSFVGYGCPRSFVKEAWNPYAENIHGISKAQAKTFPTQRTLAIDLLKFLKPYKNDDDSSMPMIIHASSYVDYNFITSMYQKVGIVGSIEKVMTKENVVRTDLIFKQFLKQKGLPCNKTNLKLMAQHFGVSLKHHECMSDTEACKTVFVKMVKFFKGRAPLESPTIDYSAFNNTVQAFQA